MPPVPQPAAGSYIIQSYQYPNLVADMAGDDVGKNTCVIAYHNQSDIAPNQKWTLTPSNGALPMSAFTMECPTRFGTQAFASGDFKSPSKDEIYPIIKGIAGGLNTRLWGFLSVNDSNENLYRIYSFDWNGYAYFWTIQGGDEGNKIVLESFMQSDNQVWRFLPF